MLVLGFMSLPLYRIVIRAKDKKGYNALHLAVKGNDPEMVRVLLRAEARAISKDPVMHGCHTYIVHVYST